MRERELAAAAAQQAADAERTFVVALLDLCAIWESPLLPSQCPYLSISCQRWPLLLGVEA
jgi:hypothetical protein